MKSMYAAAQTSKAKSWDKVQPAFLEAMWEFDKLIATGVASQGANQNGKGDFFNDLIALLIENGSGKQLYARPAVPGLVFKKHKLDATYPPTGPVEVLIETKAAGAPISPRNQDSQDNPLGRPGAADLDKRIKETAFKSIDLKAEWARLYGVAGPSGDLVDWLRSNKPKSFLFMAIRVVGEGDTARVIQFAHRAAQVHDGVGLIAYWPDVKKRKYVPQPVSEDLDLDKTLFRLRSYLYNL